MQRFVRLCVLAAVFPLLFMTTLVRAEGPLLFVGSHAELYAALEAAEKRSLGSIAVSEKYYLEGTSRTQKNQIRGLIATVLERGDRAAYIYGSSLNVPLATELLGVSLPALCSPPAFLGKLIETKGQGEPVILCGKGGDSSENGLRERLRNNNEREMGRLLSH